MIVKLGLHYEGRTYIKDHKEQAAHEDVSTWEDVPGGWRVLQNIEFHDLELKN